MSEESAEQPSKVPRLPAIGDLVIATVTRITSHGTYASLDEYEGHECFIHISEIASTWVRNIRTFVRENQKIVAKVLRVDTRRGQVDMSLRRVTKEQGRMKIQEWKRTQRGQKLLLIAAERLGAKPEEALEVAGKPIAAKFADILEGLEEAKEKGAKVLTDIGVPKKWATQLHELAVAHVVVREVGLERRIQLKCRGPEGVEAVRKALLAAQEVVASAGGEVYAESAPRYRIRVKARDFKQGEELLNRAVEESLKSIKANSGEGLVEPSS